MSGGKITAWIVVAIMGVIPLNWMRMWLIGEISPSTTLSQAIIGTIVLWTLAGGLGFFLFVGPRAAGYATRKYWRHLSALVVVLGVIIVASNFMEEREKTQRLEQMQERIKAAKAKADAIEAAKTPEQRQAEADAKVAAVEAEKLAKVEYERQLIENRKLLDEAAKADAAKECALSRKKGVVIGMTADFVKKCTSWGKPDSVNRTTNTYGVREQWVYGHTSYLYFKDGVLTSIQN